jgi:hypothetical protein
MLYEFRIYDTMPGRLPDLLARFRNHTTKLFEKHGIKNVGYFTTAVGDYSERLTYIIAFESMAHREKVWPAFANDPEWAKVKAESEKNGLLVRRVFNSFQTPTDFSPLQ